MQKDQFFSWQEIFEYCLKGLKTRYPSYSENQLSDISGIPRSTLNRQKNYPSRPRLDNYLRIILGSGNAHLLEKGLELYDSSLGGPVRKVLEVAMNEEKKKIAQMDLEILFEDRDVFVAYLLASQNNGTTTDKIQQVLGSPAKDSINILLNKNLITQEGNTLKVLGENILLRSFESIKYHLNTYTRYYKTENVGKETNYAHSLSEGLNSSGIKKLHQLHKRFHQEVQNLLRDPANQGSTPAFSVSFCDIFTNLENNGETP